MKGCYRFGGGGFPSSISIISSYFKPWFKRSEMHGDLPHKFYERIETSCLWLVWGTVVSASKRSGAVQHAGTPVKCSGAAPTTTGGK
ncbi:hypothetical protein FHEFKHOI_00973 [Candidatus Methanoperedenaceae archaeon GB50]|nr:hypothetical protein FHEFKHOI_00973 [Candidatus Methanoperedenaceae archaeon GB50]CAD7778327.1 MAG: hypothetical protein KBONHNOK_01130 [Candidatus Methanoperedenaceae archaeon GB50]